MVDFDFQWKNLICEDIDFNEKRVKEFLDIVKLSECSFKEKHCLDAGCGNGRWTYAMMNLGANVESIDISKEAITKCKTINEHSYIKDILDLKNNPIYDFVLSWGVLHHIQNPRLAFSKVASQVKKGGMLHIMVYHKYTQQIYESGRMMWPTLDKTGKLVLCKKMVDTHGGSLHGWWDAFNPTYNFSYYPDEIIQWFEEESFINIRMTEEKNINVQGIKKSATPP